MFANGLQPWHILVLVVVLIALFGAKRLPGAARGIGQSMRIFKSEAKQMRNGDDDGKDEDTATEHADKQAREQPAQLESTEQAVPEDPVRVQLQEARRAERRSAPASAQASDAQQSQTDTQA